MHFLSKKPPSGELKKKKTSNKILTYSQVHRQQDPPIYCKNSLPKNVGP